MSPSPVDSSPLSCGHSLVLSLSVVSSVCYKNVTGRGSVQDGGLGDVKLPGQRLPLGHTLTQTRPEALSQNHSSPWIVTDTK